MRGERVLDHALTLFSERGYSATSIRDIIHAAGVTQPTLCYHFADKRSLFEELIKRHYANSQQQLEQIIATEVGCETRLRIFVQRSFEFCNTDPRVPRLMFQTCHGPQVAEIDGILANLHCAPRPVVERGIFAFPNCRPSIHSMTEGYVRLHSWHQNGAIFVRSARTVRHGTGGTDSGAFGS